MLDEASFWVEHWARETPIDFRYDFFGFDYPTSSIFVAYEHE